MFRVDSFAFSQPHLYGIIVVPLPQFMRFSFDKYKRHYSALTRLGIPILLGQLGIIATSFCDTLMVGRYSTEALASASFVNGLYNLITFMSMGFSYGLTPIFATAYGKGDTDDIGRSLRNGVLLNMLFACVVLIIMGIAYLFLDKMGQPEELLPLIRPYYITVLLSMLPMIFVNAVKQFTDGITDTKLAMNIIIGGNILNIIGNYILIYGKLGFPELGLTGAGISTLAARIIMALAFVAVFFSQKRYAPYVKAFRKSRLNTAALRHIFNTSLPIAIQMGLESGSFTAASVMIGWLGKDPLASYQVMVVIGSLGFMIYYSVGASVAIKIANHCGADDPQSARHCSFAGYHLMLLCAFIACSIFYIFGEDIIRLFTHDENVVAISLSLIIPMILYQLGDATQITYANALRGLSDVRPMMYIAAIAYIIIGLPACYILTFPLHLGIVGAYLSFTVSLVVAGALFMYRFYHHPFLSKR